MDLLQATAMKKAECQALANAYGKTVRALGPANLVLVIGAGLLSLIAGVTILPETAWLDPRTAGILALISSGFTLVHTKLGCDQYQAECRKLISFYRGLAEDYESLLFAEAEELPRRFSALNEQLSASIKSTTAMPFDWALRSAQSR